MKILASDRRAARKGCVSAYVVAQARELDELADSDHPLAPKAKAAADAVLNGHMPMREAYRLVKAAKGTTNTTLLSAQVRTDIVDALRDHSRQSKQLFRDVVAKAVNQYLLNEGCLLED